MKNNYFNFKNRNLILLIIVFVSSVTFAQVGINTTTPNAASMLDVTATNKGVLLPRVALTGSNDATTIATPVTSLLIFNTATVSGANAIVPGFYYYDTTTTRWVKVVTGNDSANNIYTADGTLAANRTVTQGTNNLTFSGTGNTILNSGNVGVGNTAPTQKLDVTGNVRFSGALMPNNAAGTVGQILTSAGAGAVPTWTNAPAATTNTLGSSINTITSTVNGVPATAPAVNSVANTSSANTLLTTVNGVAGATVPIINTNTTAINGSNQLVTTVNGVASTALTLPANNIYTADGTLAGNRTVTQGANNITFDGAGNKLFTGTGNVGVGNAAPTQKLDVTGNVRFSGALMPNNAAGTVGQILTSAGAGAVPTWTNAPAATTNTLGSSINTITSTVNGVPATAPAVNSVANTSSVNTLLTTVNGVAGSTVPIINTNTTAINGSNQLVTTINGVASAALTLPANNIYTTDGTLAGNRTVTQGTNSITFAGAGDKLFTGAGSVGVGTTTPSTAFEVAGSGATTSSTIGGRMRIKSTSPGTWLFDTATNVDKSFYGYEPTVASHAFGVFVPGTGGGWSAFSILQNGNIGIGTPTPAEQLHVAGNIRFAGALMPTGLAGTAGQVLTSAGAGVAPTWANASSALQYFTENRIIAAPNAAVPVHQFIPLSAANPNIDMALTPKGNGAITANVADGGVAGGNKRGVSAVDLQMKRGTAGQVASGANSVVAGGSNNTASGAQSTVFGGFENFASGSNSVAGGASSTAEGISSVALGQGAVAEKNYSIALGYQAFANGAESVAIGSGANASQKGTTAIGQALDAQSYYETEMGVNATVGSGSTTTWAGADRLFNIGNGNPTGASSDAFTILKNGNTGVGDSTPTSTLDVDGSFATKVLAGVTPANLNGSTSVYVLTSGTTNFGWPAANTCPNRRYVIVNKTGSARTTSAYFPLLTNVAVTTIGAGKCLEIISDGTSWYQIGGNQ